MVSDLSSYIVISALVDDQWKATVAVSDELSIAYKNKVVKIEVTDKTSTLLPIRVGMSLLEASQIIHSNGFQLVNDEHQEYALGDIRINLVTNSENIIRKLELSVVDELPSNISW